jgi:homoprotocatechuate degradation regulator HpaR
MVRCIMRGSSIRISAGKPALSTELLPPDQGQTATPERPARTTVTALPLALVRVRERVMAQFRTLLARYNLTEPQWRVLRTVDQLGEFEMTELSRVTALHLPSLSRIAGELLARGYIRKDYVGSDMRRTIVRLTPSGKRLVEAASPECEEVYAAIKQAMGSEKLRQLLGLLAELETKLDTLEVSFEGAIPEIEIAPAKPRGRPPRRATG